MKIYNTNHISTINFTNHLNPYIMENIKTSALAHDLRMEAMRSLFDGLTFNQATTTSEWDALTCDDQMTLEDLIG
tara:strand:- start:305 stop:529 length:225 start_codon:yes stop_codon:yes gene_type:complete